MVDCKLILLICGHIYLIINCLNKLAGTQQPLQILEELSDADSNNSKVKEITTEIRKVYRHWLLRFPVQCVLVAEAIMWERQVTHLFDNVDPDQFTLFRSGIFL